MYVYLIPPLSLNRLSGFVSGSMSLFTPTNQIDSSCNIRREFDFFRRLFFRAPAARGSMAHIEKYIENQNFQANSRKKSWMQNLISAAHITSSSCLDKCNRFVSNFIPSRSTKCIFIMTWTPNPAVTAWGPGSVQQAAASTPHEIILCVGSEGRRVGDARELVYTHVDEGLH